MVPRFKWPALACFLAAAALLAGGCMLVNAWLVAPALLFAVLAWWTMNRPNLDRWQWLPLVVYTCGAAGGILLGIPPAIPVAGTGLMLLSWELAGQWRQQAGLGAASTWLPVLSIGAGVLLAEAGLMVRLSIPFSVLLFAGLLVLFSLHRFYQLLGK